MGLGQRMSRVGAGLRSARLGAAFLPPLLRAVLPPALAADLGPALAGIAMYVLMAAVLILKPAGLFPARA